MLVRCLLLFLTFGTPNSVMTSLQQATLSAAFFLSMLSILTNCRVVACQVNLSRMAMRKALEDSEVTHFAFFVALAFFVFIAAWEVIDRKSTFFGALTLGFRGLVIGDGDGLDFFGQKTDDETEVDEQAHKYRLVGGTLGMIVFFSYLMNLLIAIFGNTYDNAQKKVWLHFHQVRANMLKDIILSYHKFSFLNHFLHTCAASHKWPLLLTGIGLCAGGLAMQLLVGFVSLSFIQALSSLVSILMMAAGGMLLESIPFLHHDDWFPWRDNSPTQHHLHIWCRADYDEDVFLGTDETEQKYSKVLDKVAAVEEKLDRVAAVEEKVDVLGTQMTEIVNLLRRRSDVGARPNSLEQAQEQAGACPASMEQAQMQAAMAASTASMAAASVAHSSDPRTGIEVNGR